MTRSKKTYLELPIFHIHLVGIDLYYEIVDPTDENYDAVKSAHGLILGLNDDEYTPRTLKYIQNLNTERLVNFVHESNLHFACRIVFTDAGI